MKIEINDNKKLQYSLTIKIVVLAFLGLFLLIPLEMIKSIIRERQKNAAEVKKEIAFQWAGQQIISGPVLNIPVRIFPSKKELDPYVSVFHLMPESLSIKADVQTEKRHRSIYQTVVYTADLNISGSFSIPDLIADGNSEVLWKDAYFTMGISDNRGLKGTILLKMDTEVLEATPGLKNTDLFTTGISFPADLTVREKKLSFSESLKLSGSEGLSFTPVGKTTEVVINSRWNSPGFKGNFLPIERLINESGFNAKWLVTNLNRNFPQDWSGKAYNPVNDSFGVDFILPVDHYQKSLRSAKYGILFIALTFLALIFSELAIKEKIHVFHYIMVALGLVLFFSLLNALSEYIGFNFAYLISASSMIILITYFLLKLLKKRSAVYLISGLLVLLYAFIFILLTLNDFAYLAGNIGLFVLLAVTMIVSVKLDLFKNQTDSNISE
jgi:inner membrane protein